MIAASSSWCTAACPTLAEMSLHQLSRQYVDGLQAGINSDPAITMAGATIKQNKRHRQRCAQPRRSWPVSGSWQADGGLSAGTGVCRRGLAATVRSPTTSAGDVVCGEFGGV